MRLFVVDANVAVKWFVPEIHSDASRRLLRAGVELHAPDLIHAEVGNVLWKKWRRGEIAAEVGRAILRELVRLPLQIHDSEALVDLAWDVAARSGRTVYDSLYLATAIGLGSRLATADLKLVNALTSGEFERYVAWVEDIPTLE